MTFDAEKYSRVELKAKKQVMEFGKNNQNEWQILIPNPMRADGFQVEELVRKLRDAKMDTAVSDEASKKAAAAFSSGTLAGIARVTDAGGSQQIEVRKNKDDYYAKSSVVEGVHKVTSELGQGVDKSVDDFRNKKLFDFGFTDPTRVEYHAGAVSRVFVKAGEKWTSASKQMDPTSVQALIDKLRDLAATKFADKGFSTSTFEFSVTSKRAEKVSFSKSDNGYIGQRENETSLYEIDAKTADDLQKAVTDVKEAPAPKK